MRTPHHHSINSNQRGAALMVVLVIMVMGALAYLVSSLNTSGLKAARQETSTAALVQAKEALIGYAVKDNIVRTGELPCPDIDNDGQLTMNVDFIGNQCANLIGRLPWKTLGLPDLRDASGERLWYAVSDPFHANSSAVLNSDTAGTLTISGNLTANNVIAIVFAPGQSLPGQDRSTANINSPGAFLESIVSAPASFRLLTPDDQPSGNYTFNDQLMLITHDALLPSVEKVVAKRVRDGLLKSSRAFWRPYPFAAPLNNPADQNSFVTAPGTLYGLLPRHAVWASLPAVSTIPSGSATWSCAQLTGNNSLSKARLRCDFSGISGSPSFTLIGTLSPSIGLWRQYDMNSSNEVRIRIRGSSCSTPNPGWGSTVNCGAATVPGVNATISYTTNTDGSVSVVLSGTLIAAITRIELRDVVTDTAYNWFTQNEWHKVLYYAISPGYNAGGSATCSGSPPSCLAMDGSENIGALIVTMGRALAGKTHLSAIPSDYLEGVNATPANFTYENKTRSSTFNDQVIIAAP